MSARGGMPARRRRVLLMVAALCLAIAGCEYSGPAGPPAPTSAPAPPEPRSFEENAGEVARLLGAAASDPGMPSEAEPVGKLFIVLAPGDYMVTGACSGVYGAKLTIVKSDGVPEASDFECGSTLDRFVRHAGGPITISAVPPAGFQAATGVKVQPSPDPRFSELADLSEWSSKQLQPSVPGELRSASSSNAPTGGSLQAGPGRYELQFVCDSPQGAALTVATWAGAEVLAPVQVPCDGQVFTAPVELPSEGADLSMRPAGGLDARFAYRLVPAG